MLFLYTIKHVFIVAVVFLFITACRTTSFHIDPILESEYYQLNIGGEGFYEDGMRYWSDRYYLGGRVHIDNNVPGIGDKAATHSRKSMRKGIFDYSIPVANGIYDVQLVFSAASQQQFAFYVERKPQFVSLENAELNFSGVEVNDGYLTIEFPDLGDIGLTSLIVGGDNLLPAQATHPMVHSTIPSGFNTDEILDDSLLPNKFQLSPEKEYYSVALSEHIPGKKSEEIKITPVNYKNIDWYGSKRGVWVYTPPTYRMGDRPSVLLVLEHKFASKIDLQVVLDNLIAQKKIPPMLAIYVHTLPGDGRDSQNRRWEMMRRNKEWGNFILTEVFPEVRERYTFNENTEAWIVMGASSSAVGAFSLAWYFPQCFKRVVTNVGSFTSLQVKREKSWVDADKFADLLYASSRNDLRVYLSTGHKDLVDRDGPEERDIPWSELNTKMAMALDKNGHAWRYFFRRDHGHNDHYIKRNLSGALTWALHGVPIEPDISNDIVCRL